MAGGEDRELAGKEQETENRPEKNWRECYNYSTIYVYQAPSTHEEQNEKDMKKRTF